MYVSITLFYCLPSNFPWCHAGGSCTEIAYIWKRDMNEVVLDGRNFDQPIPEAHEN